MKKNTSLLAILLVLVALGVFAVFGLNDNHQDVAQGDKSAKECEIPAFAKAIGHEDLWLTHNGCPPRESGQKTDKK
jgi:hypothetical protein